MTFTFKSNLLKKKATLKSIIFLKIKASSAVTGPPIGATLGQYGIPAGPFCKMFNDRTALINNNVVLNVSVFLTVSGEYKFNVTSPSNSFFFKKGLEIATGLKKPGVVKNFVLSKNKAVLSPYLIYEIFLYKEKVSTSSNVDGYAAIKRLKGSLLSMGINIIHI